MAKIGRLLTAMITPFDDHGEVDYQQARALAKALLDSGSDGVVVAGTTGEAPSLTHEEKLRLFQEVKRELGDQGAVIAGTGNYNTAESIDMTKEAQNLGVDGALLTVPYYNKPTQEGLFQHFKAIAESTSLPCIVYNVPSRTVINMEAETTIRLSYIDNIVGVKEAGGDIGQATRIIAGASSGFLVWSGNDSDTFPIMREGGYGIISVAGHLVGKQIKHMMDLVIAGNIADAEAEHLRLMDMSNDLFIISNPMPVKYCVNRAGMKVGNPRLPLLTPDKKTAAHMDSLLKKYTIDLPVGVVG